MADAKELIAIDIGLNKFQYQTMQLLARSNNRSVEEQIAEMLEKYVKLKTEINNKQPPFSMNLKEKRMSLNITQGEFAKALGLSRTTVTMWETGESFPRADKLPLIASILGCSISELFSNEKEVNTCENG